jgi:hypothetical protein
MVVSVTIFNAHEHHHLAHGALLHVNIASGVETTPRLLAKAQRTDCGTLDAWLLRFPLRRHFHVLSALVNDRMGVTGKQKRVDDGAWACGGQLSAELSESREGSPTCEDRV